MPSFMIKEPRLTKQIAFYFVHAIRNTEFSIDR